jgi:hypothetical protein
MSLPCDNDHLDWHNGWGTGADYSWPYGEDGL